jgi:hypothetical protein
VEGKVSGNATRKEARAFWAMVQEKNLSKMPSRTIKPGTSCGTCGYFSKLRCTLKRKAVQPYNVCNEWKPK